MTLYVILPENDMSAEQIARRNQLMPAHKEFLTKNVARIWAAGPLRPDAGAEPTGSMWVVKAETKAEADAFFRTDPFFPTRSGYKILHWVHAFPAPKGDD